MRKPATWRSRATGRAGAGKRAVRSPLPLEGASESRVVADRRLQERLIW